MSCTTTTPQLRGLTWKTMECWGLKTLVWLFSFLFGQGLQEDTRRKNGHFWMHQANIAGGWWPMLKQKISQKRLYEKFKEKMAEISADLCNVFWKLLKVILKQIVFCNLQKNANVLAFINKFSWIRATILRYTIYFPITHVQSSLCCSPAVFKDLVDAHPTGSASPWSWDNSSRQNLLATSPRLSGPLARYFHLFLNPFASPASSPSPQPDPKQWHSRAGWVWHKDKENTRGRS